MTNRPRVLSDNAFDGEVLHGTYVVSNPADDDAADHEVWRIADNLRDLTWWTPLATNAERTLRVVADAAFTPDLLVVDRGHNLGGHTAILESSDDGFGTVASSLSMTVPAAVGGLGTDANGCATPEGAWWKDLTGLSAHTGWQLRIPAMGAGVAPIIAGLYLGASYRFPVYWDAPGAFDYRQTTAFGKTARSVGGVEVEWSPVLYDLLSLRASRMQPADFTTFLPHVQRLLRYRQPWWVCVDDADAEGCSLMRLFKQDSGNPEFNPTLNPMLREISLELRSVAPVLYL